MVSLLRFREYPVIICGVDDALQFEPGPGELGVFTALAAQLPSGEWEVVAGSLLTAPRAAASMSWRRWAVVQPEQDRHPGGLDLGPRFSIDPAPGVRALRVPLNREEWKRALAGVHAGRVVLGPLGTYVVRAKEWSPVVLLDSVGALAPHKVLQAARRPVRGSVSELERETQPIELDSQWELAAPPGLRPGPVLGRMYPHRSLGLWPLELLGIEWHPGEKVFPWPAQIVVGRLQSLAWIASTKPNQEEKGRIDIQIAWDENVIDPLGCTLEIVQSVGELVLPSHSFHIGDDLPHGPAIGETRLLPWDRRTINVHLNRVLPPAVWGLRLRAADGTVLDARGEFRRVESVEVSIHVMGDEPPPRPDPPSMPSMPELTKAMNEIAEGAKQAREEAHRAQRSPESDLRLYLKQRFSARAGPLLILDPYAAGPPVEDSLAFLAELAREVRVLTFKRTAEPREHVPVLPLGVEIRWLPGGATLHDRVWIVGESGLHVGPSLNGLVGKRDPSQRPYSTITRLPPEGTARFQAVFDDWWGNGTPAIEDWPAKGDQ